MTTKKLLHQYCEQHSSPQDAVLYELERETYLKTLAPQMLSGQLQGQLLRFISQLQQPKTILEIGTFTGYAAICLAQGLPEDGVMHAIEVNEELVYIIEKYFKKAGLENKIFLHVGDAQSIIPLLKTSFDLVFIDAGKHHNALYYDMIIDRLNPGGLIIVDNVLWDGKVVNQQRDKDTAAIHAFNQKIQADERVEKLMLPVRDGILIVRR